MSLKRKIAESLARDVEMGYQEGTGCCFDKKEIEEWGDQAIEAQKWFLSMAERVIDQVRFHDKLKTKSNAKKNKNYS